MCVLYFRSDIQFHMLKYKDWLNVWFTYHHITYCAAYCVSYMSLSAIGYLFTAEQSVHSTIPSSHFILILTLAFRVMTDTCCALWKWNTPATHQTMLGYILLSRKNKKKAVRGLEMKEKRVMTHSNDESGRVWGKRSEGWAVDWQGK